jgi:hypothetical protein
LRRSEFLHKQITGIPNITNQNSNFLTLQTSELKKKSDQNLWNQKQNRKSEFPTKGGGGGDGGGGV